MPGAEFFAGAGSAASHADPRPGEQFRKRLDVVPRLGTGAGHPHAAGPMGQQGNNAEHGQRCSAPPGDRGAVQGQPLRTGRGVPDTDAALDRRQPALAVGRHDRDEFVNRKIGAHGQHRQQQAAAWHRDHLAQRACDRTASQLRGCGAQRVDERGVRQQPGSARRIEILHAGVSANPRGSSGVPWPRNLRWPLSQAPAARRPRRPGRPAASTPARGS